MHIHSQSEMSIVIDIGTCGNDPINKTGFDQGDETGNAEAGRRQGTTQRQPDCSFRSKHFFGEEPAAFPQPAGVVRKENLIDEVGQGDIWGHCGRIDPALTDFLKIRNSIHNRDDIPESHGRLQAQG